MTQTLEYGSGGPDSVKAYIEDMLKQLARLAAREGERGLAETIEVAAVQAERLRKREH